MSVRALNVTAAVTALVVTGCSSTGGTPVAPAFETTTLADGVFANVEYADPGHPDYTPTTPLYASVVDFPQAAGENAPAGGHAHPSGFVYVISGTTQVNLDGSDVLHQSGGTDTAITAGRAGYLPGGAVYQLRNAATTETSHALVMTMWPQGSPANTPVN